MNAIHEKAEQKMIVISSPKQIDLLAFHCTNIYNAIENSTPTK